MTLSPRAFLMRATAVMTVGLLTFVAGQTEGSAGVGAEVTVLDALMPPFETTQEDEYLCTAVELPEKPMQLIGVEPLSEQGTVHHMLLFGCHEAAQREPVWPCRMIPACGAGGEHVLYGWGKNAPAVHLPEGTGFSVGPGTATQTVVLQVHYLNLRPAGDASGVRLHFSSKPQPFAAGLIAYASGFTIPPLTKSHLVPNDCCYSGFEPLHAFAVRVHTHSLGKSVSLDHQLHSAKSERIVDQSPQKPQGFYPIEPTTLIRPGDRLKATCDFDSSHMKNSVRAGHTSSDEMCNLYLMVASRLPFFMWCIGGKEFIKADGAGGLPKLSSAVAETELWAPPAQVASITQPSQELTDGLLVEMPLGQVSGITVDATGTVWAFHRAFRTWTASTFDQNNVFRDKDSPIQWPAVLALESNTGMVEDSWGEGTFYMPHMISIGPDGSFWLADVGSHQVLKYSPQGTLELELGTKMTPGSSTSPVQFCKPTHALEDRDGTIYVADGYCNGRVLILDAKGDFKAQLDLPQAAEKPPLPHSIALDECQRRLYVVDREVGLIHAFGLDTLSLEGSWDVGKEFGLPYAVKIGPYGTPLVLAWDRDGSGKSFLVSLSISLGRIENSWELEGLNSPHDMALLAAPIELNGTGDRMLSVLVAETAPTGSSIRKFIIVPKGKELEEVDSIIENGESGDSGEAMAGLAASHIGHTMLKPVVRNDDSGLGVTKTESVTSGNEEQLVDIKEEMEEQSHTQPVLGEGTTDGTSLEDNKDEYKTADNSLEDDVNVDVNDDVFSSKLEGAGKEDSVEESAELSDYAKQDKQSESDSASQVEGNRYSMGISNLATSSLSFFAIAALFPVVGALAWWRFGPLRTQRSRRGYRTVDHAA